MKQLYTDNEIGNSIDKGKNKHVPYPEYDEHFLYDKTPTVKLILRFTLIIVLTYVYTIIGGASYF